MWGKVEFSTMKMTSQFVIVQKCFLSTLAIDVHPIFDNLVFQIVLGPFLRHTLDY